MAVAKSAGRKAGDSCHKGAKGTARQCLFARSFIVLGQRWRFQSELNLFTGPPPHPPPGRDNATCHHFGRSLKYAYCIDRCKARPLPAIGDMLNLAHNPVKSWCPPQQSGTFGQGLVWVVCLETLRWMSFVLLTSAHLRMSTKRYRAKSCVGWRVRCFCG